MSRFLDVAGGIGDIADSVVNTAGNLITGFGYNKKWLQREIWKREDSAVQRRAADLQAAGLSKTLAAGAAAQAGPIVQSGSPGSSLGEAFSKIQARRLAREQENQARSQQLLMSLQGDKAVADTTAAIAAAKEADERAATEAYNRKWWKERNLPVGGTGGKIASEAAGLHALLMEYGKKGADAFSQMSQDLAAKLSEAFNISIEKLKGLSAEERQKLWDLNFQKIMEWVDSGKIKLPQGGTK